MSLLGRAAVFVARQIAESAVGSFGSKVGEHVGEAVGKKLAKRVDPKHGEDGEKKSAPADAPSSAVQDAEIVE